MHLGAFVENGRKVIDGADPYEQWNPRWHIA